MITLENRSVILFDAAYEAYIREEEVPHSILKVDGSREVAVEFRSFSKTAGFTGTKCAYTIVPKDVKVYDSNGKAHCLNPLWLRRQTTKFNGFPTLSRRVLPHYFPKKGKSR